MLKWTYSEHERQNMQEITKRQTTNGLSEENEAPLNISSIQGETSDIM